MGFYLILSYDKRYHMSSESNITRVPFCHEYHEFKCDFIQQFSK